MHSSQKPPPVTEALHEALSQRSFPTLESAQTWAEAFFTEHNRRAQDDFHGLSPEQMNPMLYAPFDSPAVARFQKHVPLSACDDAPLCWLFLRLYEAIGDKGIKPTAKGNLPRAQCRDLADAYRARFGQNDDSWHGPVNTETDFIELHAVHVLAGLAGLCRKYRGRIIISQKCRNLMKKNEGGALYPVLLECHIREFNWAYLDGYPAMPFVQHRFCSHEFDS